MKRSTPLRRTPLARGSSKLARSPMRRQRRARDASLVHRDYTAWIHRQPCCVPGCPRRDIEQHHKREGAGMGQRSHDRESMSLCREHHAGLHGLSGFFRGWTRELVRDFVSAQIGRLHVAYGRLGKSTE